MKKKKLAEAFKLSKMDDNGASKVVARHMTSKHSKFVEGELKEALTRIEGTLPPESELQENMECINYQHMNDEFKNATEFVWKGVSILIFGQPEFEGSKMNCRVWRKYLDKVH